ncbi:hypothetical protein J2X07_002237 [Fictibacillus barbaricus]|uniref:Uncharacterized protein n=1 Tax=Fictibacillus barbaricus TaxID=182136 RepID=A0ABU1U1G8_9BACL|nr:hypothetical protein [Fictibacillus barbaricus]
MDWSMFIGLGIALAFLRWEKNERNVFPFLKELIVFSVFMVAFSLISDFVISKMTFPFSIKNPFSEAAQLWIGGSLFFCVNMFSCF